MTTYPIVPGHEIIGEVVAAGNAVKNVKVGDKVWDFSAGVNLMLYEVVQSSDKIKTTNAGGLGWGYNIDSGGVLNITPMVLSITKDPALNDPVRTSKTVQSLQELAIDLGLPQTKVDQYSLIPELYKILMRTGVRDGKPFTRPFIRSN